MQYFIIGQKFQMTLNFTQNCENITYFETKSKIFKHQLTDKEGVNFFFFEQTYKFLRNSKQNLIAMITYIQKFGLWEYLYINKSICWGLKIQ